MAPQVKTLMPSAPSTSASASTSGVLASASSSQINLREFVADDDAANFGTTLWKTIDQSAFVLAQREAIEAFNFAKALRLSEETAAEEARRRQKLEDAAPSPSTSAEKFSYAPSGDAPASASSAGTQTEVHALSSASAGGSSSQLAVAQPMAIRKHSRRPSSSSHDAAAIPRSLAADGVQPVLLENKPSSSPPSSSFSPAVQAQASAGQIKFAAFSSPPDSGFYANPKALASASAQAQSSTSSASSSSFSSRIAKQPSQNLSLSTSSSSSLSSSPPSSSSGSSSSSVSYSVSATQAQVVDSHQRIASSSSSSSFNNSSSQASSGPSQISYSPSQLHSTSHSRASSQSNAIPAPASSSSTSHRIEHQFSKREAEPSSSPSSSASLSISQSHQQQHQQSSSSSSASASSSRSRSSSPSASAPAPVFEMPTIAMAPTSSTAMMMMTTTTTTTAKRRRPSERQPSSSSSVSSASSTSSSATYTNTNSNNTHNTTNTLSAAGTGTSTNSTASATIHAHAHSHGKLLVAPPMAESKRSSSASSSSASARDVLSGQIMNPANANASYGQSGSGSSQNAAPVPVPTSTTTTTVTPAPVLAPASTAASTLAPPALEREETRAGGHGHGHASTQLHHAQSQSRQSQAQAQNRPRHPRRATHPASASDRELFTATRNCVRCGNWVKSPRSQPSLTYDPFSLPFSHLLHLTCTACGTTHCRGCFSVAQCPRGCQGAAGSCKIRECCAGVRAVAIFEALGWFDWVFASEAGLRSGALSSRDQGVVGKGKGVDRGAQENKSQSNGQSGKVQEKDLRRAYLQQVISVSTISAKGGEDVKGMKRFEDAFVRTLRILCSWLQPLSSLESFDSEEDDFPSTSSQTPQSQTASSPQDQSLHPTIPLLIATSYLPEVMHVFLANTNVRDWVAHSETYTVLLHTLRVMFECPLDASGLGLGLGAVLLRPLAVIRESCGLAGVVWDGGRVVWDVEEQTSASASALTATATATPVTVKVKRWESFGEVVKGLERHRPMLRGLVGRGKVQFRGTVEKVESLCEGISYLLLQQVVGGI